jgi:hypothetical protein
MWMESHGQIIVADALTAITEMIMNHKIALTCALPRRFAIHNDRTAQVRAKG